MYDLIDKNLKDYYIKGHKYVFLVGVFLSLTLSILSIFYIAALISLAIIFLTISLIFFITWNKNKRKYGKKLSYNKDIITIYDYKNSKIKAFQIKNLKSSYLKIAFDEYPRFKYRSCLILYIDFEPYENMEYSSYWNESNVVIIQNSQLIDLIKRILK